MKQLIALAALPFIAAPAMAGPYVLNKTEVKLDGADYDSTTTEVRGGYEQKVSDTVKIYGEVGPGYEWPSGGDGQAILVYEAGVKADLTDKLEGKIKVEGAYGFTDEAFGNKIETTIQYNF
jgi:hypothetical protein